MFYSSLQDKVFDAKYERIHSDIYKKYDPMFKILATDPHSLNF